MKSISFVLLFLSAQVFALDIVIGGKKVTLTPIEDLMMLTGITTAAPQSDATEKQEPASGNETLHFVCKFTKEGRRVTTIGFELESADVSDIKATGAHSTGHYAAAFVQDKVKFTGDKKQITVYFSPPVNDDLVSRKYPFHAMTAQLDFGGQMKWFVRVEGNGTGYLVSSPAKPKDQVVGLKTKCQLGL